MTLREAARNRFRRDRILQELKTLESLQAQGTDRVAELDRQRKREAGDVDRLEGRSLARYFYAVIGKLDRKLTKEREEAYAADVRYETAARELMAVEEDIRRYRDELESLGDCDAAYEAAFKAELKRLRAAGDSRSRSIAEAEKGIARAQSRQREIKEALEAGESAQAAADTVLAKLDSARTWGAWDLFGGGVITDIVKHSRLDEAQAAVGELQRRLSRFRTELGDTPVRADIDVEIGGFMRFADFFFDGIFTDWAVLDRINEGYDRARQVSGELDEAMDALYLALEQEEQNEQTRREALEKLVNFE